MKNPNYVSAVFFLFFACVMMSCQKETMITAELEDKTEISNDILDPTDPATGLGEDKKKYTSVSELESGNFEVVIAMTTCSDGVTLTATNPDSSDPNFFANGDYEVVWTRNNLQETYAEGTSISCVCSSGFRVTITDGNGVVVSTSVDTPPC